MKYLIKITTDLNLNHISANELSELNLMKEIFSNRKEKWFTDLVKDYLTLDSHLCTENVLRAVTL